jgi:CelD/BcsL family acetyltransferase involved in cellulose biosynthesis
MQIDTIETFAEFERLEASWNTVYERDPEAQFFLSWTWLSQVFRQHRTGWCILAAKADHADDDYVAFFPLRLQTRTNRNQARRNEIKMAGSFSWADYTGFICLPEHDETAIPSLAKRLQQMPWAKLRLRHFRISHERLDLLLSQFDDRTFVIENRRRSSNADDINNEICPYVDLPDDFETYLREKLSTKTRQKARRFLRKIESSADLRITHSVPATHQRDLDILVDFWEQRWKERKGDKVEHLKKRYREILGQGLESDTLYMPVLWRGESALGALGSFVDWQKRVLLYFVAGRDESCTSPPPGFVLHAHSIRWAIENGLKTYDFLRGDDRYKYSFGAAEHRIHNLVVRTRSGKNVT